MKSNDWTQKEDDLLIALWNAGFSAKEIGTQLPRPRQPDSIKARAGRLRQRGVYVILRAGDPKKRAWNETEDALLVRLWNADATINELLQAFPTRSKPAIFQRAMKLRAQGVPMPARHGGFVAAEAPARNGKWPAFGRKLFADDPKAKRDPGSPHRLGAPEPFGRSMSSSSASWVV